jgi:CubicO group peptidase (beta-lactamase class C family)
MADDRAEKIGELLSSYHELELFNGAALVASNGEIIFRSGFGLANMEWDIPNETDTKFRLGSLTKQFTSMLVMQLVAEGALSLDSKVVDVLPYYRQDTGSQITVHHLLSHTSGLPGYTRPPGVESDPARDPDETEEYVKTYCSGDLEFEPGSRYRYSNTGYRLLGAIVEMVAGTSYEQLLQEKIFKPLGMEDSGYDHDDTIIKRRAAGYYKWWNGGFRHAPYVDMTIPYAAGALYSTVDDLVRWDRALGGDTLLPPRWKAKMFEPVLNDYAYGWSVKTLPIGFEEADRTVISHNGGINGFHTTIARIREDGYLVVLLNNTGSAPMSRMRSGIFDILYDREPSKPKPPVYDELIAALDSGGPSAAIERYRELKESQPESYDFGFSQLNNLCYHLMEGGQPEAAIEVCQLNVERFPQSPYPYDSLGEAYMTAGNTELAIVNYARSLQLDPENMNAVRQLMALTGVK